MKWQTVCILANSLHLFFSLPISEKVAFAISSIIPWVGWYLFCKRCAWRWYFTYCYEIYIYIAESRIENRTLTAVQIIHFLCVLKSDQALYPHFTILSIKPTSWKKNIWLRKWPRFETDFTIPVSCDTGFLTTFALFPDTIRWQGQLDLPL